MSLHLVCTALRIAPWQRSASAILFLPGVGSHHDAYVDDLDSLRVVQIQGTILDDGLTECGRLLGVAVIHL